MLIDIKLSTGGEAESGRQRYSGGLLFHFVVDVIFFFTILYILKLTKKFGLNSTPQKPNKKRKICVAALMLKSRMLDVLTL